MKSYKLCFDLDGTICESKEKNQEYFEVLPKEGMVEFFHDLKKNGHYIIIMTARNMATYNNNLGKIIANQAPIVIDWLRKYDIPYDELLFGKPHADFFIDDKGIEFTTLNNLKLKLNMI